jgi:PilZ domain
MMQLARTPDPWEEPVEERRESRRARTLRGGKILFNDRRSVLDCTIRNLSSEGARLQVESLVGVSPEFELLIDGEVAPRPCRLVWQSHDRAGVAFSPRQAETPPGDPPHAPVAATRTRTDVHRTGGNAAGPSATTGRARSW